MDLSDSKYGPTKLLAKGCWTAMRILSDRCIYDEAGNLIDDGKYRYEYDDRNLVTEVRDSLNDTFVASYAYDALKRRISELRSDGTVTQFIYDGWQEIEEVTDGTLTASFIYDDGIDRPIAMISNNHAYYYHADMRNNIAAITDENGALVERYSYDPYGAATITDELGQVITESTIGNAYRFASRRYDEATGLYYYRNRMYAPELGRFLQRDPEWYVDGMNVYAYVMNNSLNSFDPFGTNKISNGYVNINVSAGYGLGLTGGLLFDGSKIYGYIGGGVMPPSINVSITGSPDSVSEGWNVEFQAGFWGGGSVGFGLESTDGDYVEGGFVTPGVTITVFDVVEIWEF